MNESKNCKPHSEVEPFELGEELLGGHCPPAVDSLWGHGMHLDLHSYDGHSP